MDSGKQEKDRGDFQKAQRLFSETFHKYMLLLDMFFPTMKISFLAVIQYTQDHNLLKIYHFWIQLLRFGF